MVVVWIVTELRFDFGFAVVIPKNEMDATGQK